MGIEAIYMHVGMQLGSSFNFEPKEYVTSYNTNMLNEGMPLLVTIDIL